jgi:hypothetical protein
MNISSEGVVERHAEQSISGGSISGIGSSNNTNNKSKNKRLLQQSEMIDAAIVL